MLAFIVPIAETSAPTVMKTAPPAPRNRRAASASGRLSRRARQGSDAHDLDRNVEDDDHHHRHEQGRGRVPPRIASLSRRDHRDLEAAEREHQQQRRCRKGAVVGRDAERVPGRTDEERTDDDEDEERSELPERERVPEQCSDPHACQVHRSERANDGRDQKAAPWLRARRRPQVAQVVDEQVTERSARRESRQPHEPSHFESDELSEGRTRIQVRPARRAEAAAQLGEAGDDEYPEQRTHEEGEHAVHAGQRVDLAGQPEDAGADDGVDEVCDEVPLADSADEAGVSLHEWQVTRQAFARE
jgi:hypothetical protein